MKTKVLLTRVREIEGVRYSRQKGVRCPGRPGEPCDDPRPRVVRTMAWEQGVRVRYHVCGRCGTAFKSIETDPEWNGDAGADGRDEGRPHQPFGSVQSICRPAAAKKVSSGPHAVGPPAPRDAGGTRGEGEETG